MRIGEIEITPVSDGYFQFPPHIFFPGSEPDAWEPFKDLLTPEGFLRFEIGGFLVQTGDRKILVDLGQGPALPQPWCDSGHMLESLDALGVTPADITDVVFSHLHFDHVGWATSNGKVVFENATYRCDRRDWDYFVVDALADEGRMAGLLGLPSAKEKLAPIENHLETFDGDGPIGAGIDMRLAPGHTPGSTVMVLSSGTDRALLLGDATHCPIELLSSEFQVIGDVDPVLAKKTRDAIAAEVEGTATHLSAPHFPNMQFGRLLSGEGTRQWVKTS